MIARLKQEKPAGCAVGLAAARFRASETAPAGSPTPRYSRQRSTMNERDLASELMSLRDRVARLRPLSHDPEAYFVERDDIQHALGKLARRLCPSVAREARNPRARFTPGPIVVNGRIVGAFVRRASPHPALRGAHSRGERGA